MTKITGLSDRMSSRMQDPADPSAFIRSMKWNTYLKVREVYFDCVKVACLLFVSQEFSLPKETEALEN